MSVYQVFVMPLLDVNLKKIHFMIELAEKEKRRKKKASQENGLWL